MNHPLLEQARALQSRTVALRREIHRHPELGLDLPRTRETVLDSLAGLDLDLALAALVDFRRQRLAVLGVIPTVIN